MRAPGSWSPGGPLPGFSVPCGQSQSPLSHVVGTATEATETASLRRSGCVGQHRRNNETLKSEHPPPGSQGNYLEGRPCFPEESSPWERVPAASPHPCPERLALVVPKQRPPGVAEGGAAQISQGRGTGGTRPGWRREGRSAARRGSSQVPVAPAEVGEGCGQVLKILTRAS